MKYAPSLFAILLCIMSCSKKAKSKKYVYSENEHYTGKLAINKACATIIVTDVDTGISFEATMEGVDPALEFPVHIHNEDKTQPYGYSGNPILGLGGAHNGHASQSITTKYSFAEFTENFYGFLVVHDPANAINDTLTHVVYGKIGSWK